MNTGQIAYALEQDPKTSKKFCGVFPSDKLPQTIDKYPCGIVANTDPSTKPGKHWISVYFSSPEKGSWFDSYGKSPKFYGAVFTDFLEKHCDEWDVNDRKLQSNWSDVCGQYCIFFLSHRARGYSMNKIVQLFGKDTVLNDSKVLWFVKTHFRVALNQPSVGFVQCCKKLIK